MIEKINLLLILFYWPSFSKEKYFYINFHRYYMSGMYLNSFPNVNKHFKINNSKYCSIIKNAEKTRIFVSKIKYKDL